MCGITGIVGQNLNLGDYDFNKIIRSMRHRGPDYQDFVTKKHFYFFHSLLKIMDLSKYSHQPLKDKNENIIIYNGSIYNYKKLKESTNYKFKTNTDTEVILYLYNKFGLKFLNMINGMFAIALFDKKKNKIFLVRDQIGIKPIYFTVKNDIFLFSSEIKILTNNFFSKKELKPNNKEILNFISFRHYNNNGNTFYEGIQSLKPGHFIEYDLNTFKYKIKEYFNFSKFCKFNKNLDKDYFNQILNETVKDYSTTEHKKIATLLSGGVDSSLITLALKKLNPGKQINTFSAILKKKNEENKNIKKIIIDNKIKNFKINTEKISFISELEKTITNVETPLPDASMIIHNILCKKVKEKGFKVLLSGNGGDEFFFGYPSHKIGYISNSIENQNFIEFLKRFFKIYKYSNYNFFYILFHSFKECLNVKVKNFFKNLQSKIKLLTLNISSLNLIYYNQYHYKVFENLVLNNIYKWTSPLFLDYEDKNSMAHSIESRVPLYDINLAKYSMSIKLDYHFKNGSKSLLKNSPHIPPYVKNMKAKYGFAAPLYELILKNKKEIIIDIKNNFTDIPLIDPKKLFLLFKNLKKNYEIFFRIYTYGKWYNLNFEKQKKIKLSCIGLWHISNLVKEFKKNNYSLTVNSLYPKFLINKKIRKYFKGNYLLYFLNRYRNFFGKKIGFKISILIHQIFSSLSYLNHEEKYCILWSGNALEFLKKNHSKKKNKAICILERCSTHYSHQLKILNKLNDECGINWSDSEYEYEKKMMSRELEEYKLSDFISVPSNFVKQTFIKNGISEKKIFVNNYGADTENFYPLNCNVEKKKILFAGHACIRKGFHTLLDCLDELNKHEIELVHFGTMSNFIKEKINKNNYKNLQLNSSVNIKKLNKIYNSYSMLVLPSFEEGMAHVQLQALSAGLPVIGTIESGILDIFQNSKLYLGELTEAGNIKKIIKSILACNEKFKNTFHEKKSIHEEIKKKFSWKNYALRYDKFLSKINII